ncbi:hypothetical protein PQ610_00585 [Tardisphaera miroshnichenkoae]
MELDYKSLLRFISAFYQEKEFSSTEFAGSLRSSLRITAGPAISSKRLRNNEISNDLRRLYGMGFLTRKRTKRKTKSGNKGYCYVYRLSHQGLSYLDYMKRGPQVSPDVQPYAEAIRNALPGTTMQTAISAVKQMRMKKGYKRFRTTEDALLTAAFGLDAKDEVLDQVNEVIDKAIKKKSHPS